MSTIVALATAPLNCAIHIIRISGPDTFEILQKICKKPIKKIGYSIQRNVISDSNKVIDDVLLNVFVAPKSFTGEDSIEINCHGGVYLAFKIINLLIKKGCLQAKPGEFSQRSMLNKKICYSQAESINNLIYSTNDLALEVSISGVLNNQMSKVNDIRNMVFNLVGAIEVNIDYPEYDDVPEITHKLAINKLKDILQLLVSIQKNTATVLPIIEGIKVAIIGSPNAGKSSLFNLLIQQDKAIVSNIKGTTRDVVEAKVNIDNLTYTFSDTAGVHSTSDQLELLGINKTHEVINNSDIIIWVLDPNEIVNKEVQDILKNKNYIKVYNKSDIKKFKGEINISVLKKQIKPLLEALKKASYHSDFKLDTSDVLYSNRQLNLLNQIIELISDSISELKQNTPLDIIGSTLQKCIILFNNIVGKSLEYDMLDELFSKFCVGK